jgi:hypothetical protein
MLSIRCFGEDQKRLVQFQQEVCEYIQCARGVFKSGFVPLKELNKSNQENGGDSFLVTIVKIVLLIGVVIVAVVHGKMRHESYLFVSCIRRTYTD